MSPIVPLTNMLRILSENIVLANNTKNISYEVPENPDGGELYNYDTFFEIEFIYFMIPNYAIIVLVFANMINPNRPDPVYSMASAPTSQRLKMDLSTYMVAVLQLQFLLIRVVTVDLMWQVAFPRFSILYTLEIFSWFISFRLAIYEYRHNLAAHPIHRGFWQASFLLVCYKFCCYREWSYYNMILLLLKFPVLLIQSIYAVFLPTDRNNSVDYEIDLREIPPFVQKIVIFIEKIRGSKEEYMLAINSGLFEPPPQDDAGLIPQTTLNHTINPEYPPKVEITVNMTIYTINNEKHFEIIVFYENKKLNSKKTKISDISKFIKFMKEKYNHMDFPVSGQQQNNPKYNLDDNFYQPENFQNVIKYYCQNQQTLQNIMAEDCIYWSQEFQEFIGQNIQNNLEIEDYIEKQKNIQNYGTITNPMDELGARKIISLTSSNISEPILSKNNSKVQTNKYESIPPDQNVGCLFEQSQPRMFFESYMHSNVQDQEDKLWKVTDDLFTPPYYQNNKQYYTFCIEHLNKNWEIAFTISDFCNCLTDIKTSSCSAIDRIVTLVDFRIKTILELERDLYDLRNSKNRATEADERYHNNKVNEIQSELLRILQSMLDDKDWHCSRLYEFIEYKASEDSFVKPDE